MPCPWAGISTSAWGNTVLIKAVIRPPLTLNTRHSAKENILSTTIVSIAALKRSPAFEERPNDILDRTGARLNSTGKRRINSAVTRALATLHRV
jgi:hypothetical protein